MGASCYGGRDSTPLDAIDTLVPENEKSRLDQLVNKNQPPTNQTPQQPVAGASAIPAPPPTQTAAPEPAPPPTPQRFQEEEWGKALKMLNMGMPLHSAVNSLRQKKHAPAEIGDWFESIGRDRPEGCEKNTGKPPAPPKVAGARAKPPPSPNAKKAPPPGPKAAPPPGPKAAPPPGPKPAPPPGPKAAPPPGPPAAAAGEGEFAAEEFGKAAKMLKMGMSVFQATNSLRQKGHSPSLVGDWFESIGRERPEGCEKSTGPPAGKAPPKGPPAKGPPPRGPPVKKAPPPGPSAGSAPPPVAINALTPADGPNQSD